MSPISGIRLTSVAGPPQRWTPAGSRYHGPAGAGQGVGAGRTHFCCCGRALGSSPKTGVSRLHARCAAHSSPHRHGSARNVQRRGARSPSPAPTTSSRGSQLDLEGPGSRGWAQPWRQPGRHAPADRLGSIAGRQPHLSGDLEHPAADHFRVPAAEKADGGAEGVVAAPGHGQAQPELVLLGAYLIVAPAPEG